MGIYIYIHIYIYIYINQLMRPQHPCTQWGKSTRIWPSLAGDAVEIDASESCNARRPRELYAGIGQNAMAPTQKLARHQTGYYEKQPSLGHGDLHRQACRVQTNLTHRAAVIHAVCTNYCCWLYPYRWGGRIWRPAWDFLEENSCMAHGFVRSCWTPASSF